MTVVLLPEHPAVETIRPFDVVGTRSERHLSHVAIVRERAARRVSRGGAVSVIHMTGPLRGLRDEDPQPAHVVGSMRLSKPERRRLEQWASRWRTSGAVVSYCVAPAHSTRSESGIVVKVSFSCAGFVQAGFTYAAAITLVDEAALPDASRELLEQIWDPTIIRLAQRRGYLTGEGPWPVLLPAHILHALDRDDPRDSAYQPGPDDWDYPRPR